MAMFFNDIIKKFELLYFFFEFLQILFFLFLKRETRERQGVP